MFRYQHSLFNLTTKKSSNVVKHLTSVRFNSSSVGNKVQLNNTTTTATVDKEKTMTTTTATKPNEPFDLENKKKIPFMPVINIPETEFAHNAFFSLYRPLLGLSDEDETPFFTDKPKKTKEEMDQMFRDTHFQLYISSCIPFVAPTRLATPEKMDDVDGVWSDVAPRTIQVEEQEDDDEEEDKTEVSFKVVEEFQDYEDLYGGEEQDNLIEQENPIESFNRPLPMFHMPESGDVLDYLTSVESKMKQEHAKLDSEEKLKALRLKKMEILSGVSRYHRNKPRFYATNNRNIHQRLRRYQQKWMLKE